MKIWLTIGADDKADNNSFIFIVRLILLVLLVGLPDKQLFMYSITTMLPLWLLLYVCVFFMLCNG